MDETGGKASVFGDVLLANLAADAIKAGLSAIVDMVKAIGQAVKDYVSDSMELAAAATESQTLLTQVMRNTMDATDDEIKSLLNLAEAQEKVGVVSRTAQTTALAELASFVERKESLEDMLPVMNDYIAYQYGAAASSDQARNVATALGKAINGSIDGLAKQGFTLTQNEREWFKTANEMERVNFITEMVSESMAGLGVGFSDEMENVSKDMMDSLHDLTENFEDMASDMRDILSDSMEEGLGNGFDKALTQVKKDLQSAIPMSIDIPNLDLNVNTSNNLKSVTDGYSNNISGVNGPLFTIQQMIVRSDDDIRRISQELYKRIEIGARAQGRLSFT